MSSPCVVAPPYIRTANHHSVGSCDFLAQAIQTTNISNAHDTNMHTTSFSKMAEQVEED